MARRLLSVCALLWLSGASLLAQEPKPQELTPDEQKLAAEARKLDAEAALQYRQGKAAEAVAKLSQSLEIVQRLYPRSKHPDGHPELASRLNNLAVVLWAAGSPDRALPFCEQALAMHRTLYPKSRYPSGHRAIVASLNSMSVVLQAAGSAQGALPYAEEALEITRALYPQSRFPDGHADLAGSLMNLGSVRLAAGSAEKAAPLSEQALAMYRALYPGAKYPDGRPEIAIALNNMGEVLRRAGSADKALPYYEQALAMLRTLYPKSKYPDGHPQIAASLSNLGLVLTGAGSVEKALPCYEEALAMNRALYPSSRYPDGHPDLAVSLNSMGFVLQSARSPEKALPYYEQALAMRRKLHPTSKYPDGHPEVARSLTNLGAALLEAGSAQKALPTCAEALAMYRTLHPTANYPEGHPDLAGSLNNMGFVLEVDGSAGKALAYYEEALAMHRTLYVKSKYPDGHPNLVVSLKNVGAALQASGSAEKALPFYEQALSMNRALGQGLLLTSSEEGTLAYVQAQSAARDLYLSAVLGLPNTEAAAYRIVWQGRAAVSRVLELRHAAARTAGPAAAEGLVRLKENRRRTEQLLQDSRRKPEERDKDLVHLADERDVIERQLAKDLPILARWSEREKRTPDDLARALPVGAAFVDLLPWTRFEFDPQVKGRAGEKHIPSYLAFAVTNPQAANAPGSPIARIDLGPAEPINTAVRSWRQAIDRQEASDATGRLRTLLWDKIAQQLPPGTRTLYLAADSDLARLPWPALPIGKDRVLLEDYALAIVPHGPFLLEQLDHPQKHTGPESLLTLGDVSYKSATWPALPGTRNEIGGIASLAPSPPIALTKADATATKLTDLLSRVRYAHLATHGDFQADAFAAEQQRLLAARRDWELGKTQEARRVAAKNPLGYVGLVLAGGERLSGLSILGLDLENLKLVTLSACETGLGEYTGGKGVENLQQAFHLAGCPNVVASLWKVNDAATAALMVKFYHEMWVNQKPPIEALREAQLTIYHHPELIPDLAGERGTIKVKKAAAVKSDPSAKPQAAKRADTKLWAAFVLSGGEIARAARHPRPDFRGDSGRI
jgi:CHAT domain-containing protein/tetratricopeptide (TPR) repeat protein